MVQVKVLTKEHGLIVLLSEATRAQIDTVGSKAANLGAMLQAGFPVPEGFIITAKAFEYFMASNDLNNESSYEDVLNSSTPTFLEDQIRSKLTPYASFELAVRSSGVAEDLADASFAGQYETVLGVRGFEELSKAILRCWASAFSERVSSYIAEKGNLTNRSMAVLVQRLIYADSAGVAFSANPLTGDRDECVINSVKGLGESLVSGKITPDEWIVKGDDVLSISLPENAITKAQARKLAYMVKKAESLFGEPQDIEWAIKDEKMFILQSRPITALPEQIELIPVPINPPPGYWTRESEHFPEPLSPMFRSTIIPRHEKGIASAMEEYSILIDGVQFREIGGWLYTRVVPLGGKEVLAPPKWIQPLITPLMIRLIPSLRKRVNGLKTVYRSELPLKNIDKWHNDWKPNNIEKIKLFKLVDLKHLSDEELKGHLEQMLAFMSENSKIHAKLTGSDFLIADFILASKRILGWDERKSLQLLSGLSITTTEPSKRLGELAKIAGKDTTIIDQLNNMSDETVKKIAAINSSFTKAFTDYMSEFGDRTLTAELNKEALNERPELVLKLIRDQLKNNYNYESEVIEMEEKRSKIITEAKKALSEKTLKEREEFESSLKKAELVYPVREDHEYYLHNAPLALLRKAFLEIGVRLASRGYIEHVNDIFFLELEEALQAFNEGHNVQDLVKRRKGELAWVKAHPGPISYGGPPMPPPSMNGFPYEVKRVMEGMLWMIEGNASVEYLERKTNDSPIALTGIAASPGQYTGPVRVIMSEEDFHKILSGDVLVCPTTQPPWSVLFPSIGALVTDAGGILSHPAIIAREYQVPAVVATGNATTSLYDNQIVTVNGNNGKIIVT